MALDLLELTRSVAAKSAVEKIGGMAGLPPARSAALFDALAGAVVAGLVKKAGSAGGAEDIFRLAQKQDPGLLDRLGELVGGGAKTDDLLKSGMGLLDSIFGGDRTALLSGLAKTLGVEPAKLGQALAILAPVVIGVIGKQIRNRSLNAAGLGSLLGDQAGLPGSVLPAGFANGTGQGKQDRNFREPAAPAGKTGSESGRAVAGAGREFASAKGSVLRFVLVAFAIGLLIAGGLWWYVTPRISELKDSGLSPRQDPPAPTGGASGGAAGGGGGTGAMGMTLLPPDLGGFELQAFSDELVKVTDSLKTLDVATAPALSEQINALMEKMPSYGLEKVSGRPKMLIQRTIVIYLKRAEDVLAAVADPAAVEAIRPALNKLNDFLKAY